MGWYGSSDMAGIFNTYPLVDRRKFASDIARAMEFASSLPRTRVKMLAKTFAIPSLHTVARIPVQAITIL